MMTQRVQTLDDIRYDEPMSRHTSWRIGGPADVYFKPRDRGELVQFLQELEKDVPILWVGLGSNLLIRDGGFRGAVIATHKALGMLTHDNHGVVYAEAGVACAKVAKKCVRWKYKDAHFFAGIPGTVGGALAMNAGAFGGETWDYVQSVETVNRDGVVNTYTREHFDIGYRHVASTRDEWFLAASFAFEQTDQELGNDIKELLVRRKESQPIGLPSCGSVFRNPEGDFAARLIEAAGLKGHVVGGAQVSPKHANFIINTGDATAADVEALIALIRSTVKSEFDRELIPEVRVAGEQA
ncbi:MAG: UDP-N-acetylmuramate dehydrogenase [Gammaproteobacteria bacterium]